MSVKKYLQSNARSLKGKRIAITGSTGGLGRQICTYLASLGAQLWLLDRNAQRSADFRDELMQRFKNIRVSCINTELEDICSVNDACEQLERIGIDALILNAGAYAIPRHKCSTGYDNIFQINFVSPYFMVNKLMPMLKARGGRVVVVGSIAHRYSKTDMSDVDFSTRSSSALAYGNSKRFLMFSLYGLFEESGAASLSVTHPGITLTNITAHYPKLIFAVIKHPMRVIFMKPEKASLSVLQGVLEPCGHMEWIGPRFFEIWGLPKKKKLRSVGEDEYKNICIAAQQIYKRAVSTLK